MSDTSATDLDPLAGVLSGLKSSLEVASKAIHRFMLEAQRARDTDSVPPDTSLLHTARQQLQQAVGAMDTVGMDGPVKILRSIQALAEKFVQQPEVCDEDAAIKADRAGWALVQFLEGVLQGNAPAPVALFPPYRSVHELAGSGRAHPADLWSVQWRWIAIDPPDGTGALDYSPDVRSQMDRAVLQWVKSGDILAVQCLRDVCAGLSVGVTSTHARTFWRVCAAFFEAIAGGCCPVDVYTKRTASRVLQQYASLARGGDPVSESLAREVLFFCAISDPGSEQPVPLLAAVRGAYGLETSKAIDYEADPFGRVAPALHATEPQDAFVEETPGMSLEFPEDLLSVGDDEPVPRGEAVTLDHLDFPLPDGAEKAVLPVQQRDPGILVDEADEPIKVIGHLRLGIPLYNVFLNEADEWSRRLQVELSEWVLEVHRPVPDVAVMLAHSLAGSSSTVGFVALSEMARALEQALQCVPLNSLATPAYAQVFNTAAEEIRRLLHQFAAGFLKDPKASILRDLRTIVETLNEDTVVPVSGDVMAVRSRMEVHMSQIRSSLGELDANLDRLRQQLCDGELQPHSVQEWARMMTESVGDIATVHRHLQRLVQATEDDLAAQESQTR